MVRVRYAPSPTGHIHVGNARTAIFNYLYASMKVELLSCASTTPISNGRQKRTSIQCSMTFAGWAGLGRRISERRQLWSLPRD